MISNDEENWESLTDEELVSIFLEGKDQAFEAIVHRYHAQILNLAYRILGNRTDADDVTQEIFVLLYRKLKTFRGESRFSTWLYRVSVNACRDHIRKNRLQISLSSRSDEDMPEWEERIAANSIEHPDELLITMETQKKVQAAMKKLPQKFLVVLYLHDIKGYDYKEISEILGISLGTVKSRLNRARQKMLQELAPLPELSGNEEASNLKSNGEDPQKEGPSFVTQPRRENLK